MGKLTAREIAALSIPADVARIAGLPPPEASALADSETRVVRRTVESFLDSWAAMLKEYSPLSPVPIDVPCPGCGKVDRLAGTALWNRALMSTGAYLDFSVRRLLGMQQPRSAGTQAGQALAREAWARLEFGPLPTEEAVPADFFSARALSASYWGALGACQVLLDLRRASRPRDAVSAIESGLHAMLANLAESVEDASCPDQRLLAARLLRTVLDYADHFYEMEKAGWDKDQPLGPFSSIRLGELPRLADRADEMIRKYGVKQVERVLEQQVALVIQSLGFFVVPTRSGQRTPDLLCISGDLTSQFSFVLEVKASRRAYSLPTDDERALSEYVSGMRESVPAFGQLRFALIIGPRPARTLEGKLTRLQSQIHVPVRFCSARELVDLRELAPSLLPMGVFLEAILDAAPVLPAGFGKGLAKKYNQAQAVHQTFVRDMLSLQDIRRIRPSGLAVGPWCDVHEPDESAPKA